MKLSINKIGKLDGKTCFICGKYLLNNTSGDLAYIRLGNGQSMKAKPDKYYLFRCPKCSRIGHKRCWFDHGEKKIKRGWFKSPDWQLVCPGCGSVLSDKRPEKIDWKEGYQIPGYPDQELYELVVSDVFSWKAGSMFSKVRTAIGNFFTAVGLGSLTSEENKAIRDAADRIGKKFQHISEKVFRLEIPEGKTTDITSLTCQNCGAPLPVPDPLVEAVVCEHCNTAHLLP
ncbi:MAG: hypothetical protein GF411_12670 [Candidatus Lokiarchaeota archaeon]|nr:hypothetical protein [Candidatus Lokiarchaeota archaeon]